MSCNLFVRRLSTSSLRSVHINHEFHKVIKYVRPEKLPPWAPQRSCDLQSLPKLDKTLLTVKNKPFSQMLDSLPEDQRKAFTVGFAPRSAGMQVLMEEALNTTRRHKYDNESWEFQITWATMKIRNYQHLLATDRGAVKNSKVRVAVKELIEKRKKKLSRLRNQDYRRFEWLLEILQILYKPNIKHTRVERKASLDVIVNIFCHEIRENKLKEYKELLDKEKVSFLQEKLSTLQQIELDEKSIKLSSSVSEDIKDTLERISRLTATSIPPLSSATTDKKNELSL